MPTTYTAAPPTRWAKANTWAGYLVFGLPAALAAPALLATLARFGLWATLTGALPAAVWAGAPLLLWLRYTRRRPRTRTGKVTWALAAVGAIATLIFSPLFFWAGPAVLVLASEVLRIALAPSVARLSSAVGVRRRKPRNLPTRGTR